MEGFQVLLFSQLMNEKPLIAKVIIIKLHWYSSICKRFTLKKTIFVSFIFFLLLEEEKSSSFQLVCDLLFDSSFSVRILKNKKKNQNTINYGTVTMGSSPPQYRGKPSDNVPKAKSSSIFHGVFVFQGSKTLFTILNTFFTFMK